MDIFRTFLPARLPELNPIELVCSYLVPKLRASALTVIGENIAKEILDGMSRDGVEMCQALLQIYYV